MVCQRLGQRAKNDPDFGQLILKGGRDRHTVEHRIDRNSGQSLLLLQRNAQLVVGLQQFRIYFVETLGSIRITLGCRVVTDRLEVYGGVANLGPVGLLHVLPTAKSVQSPLKNEVGLIFFGGKKTNDVFIQARRQGIGFDVRDKAFLVLTTNQFIQVCHWHIHCVSLITV